jgi:hypothetical protein
MQTRWLQALESLGDGASRRVALGLAGGGGLGALLGLRRDHAAARKKGKKKKNKKKPPQPVLTFDLERSEAAVGDDCLAGVSGRVRVFELGFAERMEVSIAGLPANTEFDVFVIQVPDAPFGMSWYQGDMTTDGRGRATESFVGRFNEETFIVAPGSQPAPVVHQGEDDNANPATDPIHTAHVGIWFNSPDDAAAAGCGDDVTPFNGDHTAGIQILSTRGFGDLEGPLLQIGS